MEPNRGWRARSLATGLSIGGLLLIVTGCPASQLTQPVTPAPAPSATPGPKATLDQSSGETIFMSGVNGGMACKTCHSSASLKGRTIDQLNASNRSVPAMAQYASGTTALTQEQVAELATYLANPS